MHTIEKLIHAMVFWPIAPVIGLLTGWWGSLMLFPNTVIIAAMVGSVIGLIIDVLLFYRNPLRMYDAPWFVLGFVYVFYAFCMFGFFMAVPVFHPILGVVAACISATKIRRLGKVSELKSYISTISIFTAIVMFLVCFASAWIALSDSFTGANLKGMFRLSSEPASSTLWLFIIGGGILLIAIQYCLTRLFLNKLLRNN